MKRQNDFHQRLLRGDQLNFDAIARKIINVCDTATVVSGQKQILMTYSDSLRYPANNLEKIPLLPVTRIERVSGCQQELSNHATRPGDGYAKFSLEEAELVRFHLSKVAGEQLPELDGKI